MENTDYLCPYCGSLSSFTSSKKELLHCKKCNNFFALEKELVRRESWNPHITSKERSDILNKEYYFSMLRIKERMEEELRRQKDESES